MSGTCLHLSATPQSGATVCHFLSSTCKAQRSAEHSRAWGALSRLSGTTVLLALPCRPHVHTSGAAAGQRGRVAGRRRGPGHADARLPVRQVPGGPHPGADRGGMVVSFTQRLSLEHHPQHHIHSITTLSRRGLLLSEDAGLLHVLAFLAFCLPCFSALRLIS